jgi:hypothetical protein
LSGSARRHCFPSAINPVAELQLTAITSDRIVIKYRNRSQNHENYPLDLQKTHTSFTMWALE